MDRLGSGRSRRHCRRLGIRNLDRESSCLSHRSQNASVSGRLPERAAVMLFARRKPHIRVHLFSSPARPPLDGTVAPGLYTYETKDSFGRAAMLTQAENELLCRVEGDAPMGRLMRRP